MDKDLIRNFSIIAHIDHGKSTLADRLLEKTGAVNKREFREQFLDDMDLERERGITIKSSAVTLKYKRPQDKKEYLLNLIDTPGHVDFAYEVSKSQAACEGTLLVVDAAQGVEAQTVANLYLALEHNLVIIPVINKIDLSTADAERVKLQITDILRLKEEDIILASAKEGIGTEEILEAIVQRIPPPKGDASGPLQALIFDSIFDTFKGAIAFIRLFNGTIATGMKIKMMQSQNSYEVQEVGVFNPHPQRMDRMECGEVGYLACNLKDPQEVLIGDTVTGEKLQAKEPLAGYKKAQPMVFCGIYPTNPKDFPRLREALEKFRLNDSSFIYEPESSPSAGFGFRCGFLGLLHMEIVQERLQREYDLDLLLTTPSVVYRVKNRDGQILKVDNPTNFPAPQDIEKVEEPFIRAFIMIPTKNLGDIMELAKQKRAKFKAQEFLSVDRIKLIFEMPLSEAIVDFYDKIKSATKGYGSLDYEYFGYLPCELVRLDILINGQLIDAFSCLVHQEKIQKKARALANKLKELIPRQLFEVTIQAAAGGRIIVKEKIRPLGKHVTGKCYGGDVTRKRKLWAKQKAGKKRMKQIGKVQIPQEAFMAALKI